MSGRTVCHKNFFAPLQGISENVLTLSRELFERKAGLPDALANVGSVISEMIRLSVMTLAVFRRDHLRVFIRVAPTFDHRSHDQREPPGLKDAKDFLQCLPVVDMLENM